jgi:DNA-binding Xre family transcriptional regulator
MKKFESEFDKFIKDKKNKNLFDEEYKKLEISESILEAMEKKKLSVRKLSSLSGVSTSIIQELRAGTKANITLINLLKILYPLNMNISIKAKKR